MVMMMNADDDGDNDDDGDGDNKFLIYGSALGLAGKVGDQKMSV